MKPNGQVRLLISGNGARGQVRVGYIYRCKVRGGGEGGRWKGKVEGGGSKVEGRRWAGKGVMGGG